MKENTARSWLLTAEGGISNWLAAYNLESGQISMSRNEQIQVIMAAALLSIARSLMEANDDA